MTARFAAALVAAVAAIGLINAHTIGYGRSFVITGSRESGRILSRNKRNVNGSAIKSLHITSVIESRFARVTYESQMENNKDVAKEMIFSVRLPSAAFITEFRMVVGGISFVGKVKEKETAKKQYEQAVERGHSAGLVVADVRETHTFDISANVPPHSKVDFHLVYQQLLERKLGQYEHVITVSPEQPIDDFVVDVYITERSGITTVSTISPKSSDKGKALTENLDVRPEIRRSKYQAKISFKPTPTEFRRFLKLDEDEQKFTVRYDVTREVLGGEIKTRNGYFVHFFAPENLPVLAKRVVFVIDTSGSMSGRKIQQTKAAFTSVIKELRESDKFNILTFASHVTTWRDAETGVVDVTERSIRDAIAHVAKISASGSTNLNEAILDATSLLERVSATEDSFSSIIVLTDGNPTVGVTTSSQIRLNAQRRINGRFSLFCLGFGSDVDQDFLKRLSAENNGIARKIYQDADADLQLEGFFQEVATPLLLNLRMTYTGADFNDVSQTDFNKYFKGSEKVVVGTFDAGEQIMGIQSIVRGNSGSGEFVESVTSTEIDETFQHWYKDTGEFDDFIERLWAYFTIRKSLEKRTISEDRVEKQEMTDRIMSLALKYSFVTPLTSLVVTLPEDEMSINTDRTTIRPPPTGCYNPSDPLPGNPLRHPIQCPVILNRSAAKKTAQRTATSPGRRQTQRIISSMASQPGFTSARLATSRSDPRFSYYRSNFMMDASLSRSASYHRYFPRLGKARRRRPSPTTAPTQWDGCTSDPLTALTGTLKLPANQHARYDTFCTLTIKLRRGSWIDLYIETANTTKNSVVITSKRQTVFQHDGGNSGSRYISLEHRKAKLEFKVYRTDRMRPGIVITYRQFIPNTGHPMVYAPMMLPESPPTCGEQITASELSNGAIWSPNYPDVYPDGSYCQWSINMVGVEGHHLELSFGAIDIESSANGTCIYDKLIIRIGEPEQDRIFCGFHTPENVIIESSVVYIFFVTDEKLGASGFQMSYQVVPVE